MTRVRTGVTSGGPIVALREVMSADPQTLTQRRLPLEDDPFSNGELLFEAMLVFVAKHEGDIGPLVAVFDLRTGGAFNDANTGVIVIEGYVDVECSEPIVRGRTQTPLVLEVSSLAVVPGRGGRVRLEVSGASGGYLRCAGMAAAFLLGDVPEIGEYATSIDDRAGFDQSIQSLDSSFAIHGFSRMT
jgi:hypothetical protein